MSSRGEKEGLEVPGRDAVQQREDKYWMMALLHSIYTLHYARGHRLYKQVWYHSASCASVGAWCVSHSQLSVHALSLSIALINTHYSIYGNQIYGLCVSGQSGHHNANVSCHISAQYTLLVLGSNRFGPSSC